LPVEIDLELPGYKSLMESMGSHSHGNGQNFVESQAIKDATMAHFILKGAGGNQVLHINGSYHTQNGEGIIWFITKQKPDTNIFTIQAVEQDDITVLDAQNIGKADFIICIPSSMTKTFHSR
jgi:uncharacterized iron-regulated protein